MVDSTAAFERDTNASSYSAVNGDRPAGERVSRSRNQTHDGLDGAGPEHASALLRMGAVKQDAGEYSEAAELFGRALEIGERSLGPDNPAIIPALTSLASARLMAGKLEKAQELAIRVVAISEHGLAEHEPDVAILLNDLARMCLKQSAHAVAEPLLLRLVAMKRSKGEDHPEVGTVLASLATVRQALGRHESAEQLWRRVLEIRERTLAPNHFSFAVALEHLAEACAARGKTAEALQLFQRAQAIRELTLGAGHPSLRVSRDRIADLQLQAEESLDAPSEVPAAAPEKYRLLAVNPGANSPIVSSPPPAREKSAAPRKPSAPVTQREPSVVVEREPSVVIEREPSIADFSAPSSQPFVAAHPIDTEPPKADSFSYRDVILSIQQEMEDEEGAKRTAAMGAGLFAPVVAAVKERQKATIIGVGVVALLVVLATASRGWTESDQPASAAEASPSVTGPVATPSGGNASAGRPVVLASDPSNAAAVAVAAATPVTASRIRLADQRPADQRPAAKKPTERSAEPARISIPRVSSALSAGFDSVVRARSRSEATVGESFSVEPTPLTAPPRRMTFDRDDQGSQPTGARLIGSLPTPRIPAQLGNTEGEVRLRFDVDALGRPVMSSVSVVRSPSSILTSAVLKVIPGLRFEPARSGGADSKAVADVVMLTFEFKTTK
jgi:TonB family protein